MSSDPMQVVESHIFFSFYVIVYIKYLIYRIWSFLSVSASYLFSTLPLLIRFYAGVCQSMAQVCVIFPVPFMIILYVLHVGKAFQM